MMEVNEIKTREYVQRLMLARMRILGRNGFFGLLLMHIKFSLDEGIETAATDGKRIIFAPKFLDVLSDDELEFIILHEIMHVILRHTARGEGRDDMLFNIACDIVINSNILKMMGMNRDAITLNEYGESMHIAPGGREGYEYTSEEVYELIYEKIVHSGSELPMEMESFDDHSLWGEDDYEDDAIWRQRIKEALEASKGRGNLPAALSREIDHFLKPRVDWRTILNDFVQEETVDYSLMPPDRRFQDSPFFLPDFNERDYMVKDVLFMIDTSASMSNKDVAQAYSEIKGAIDQYNDKLKGWLGFFDAEVIKPRPFSDEGEFRLIKPKGGGGTDFHAIFDYINREMTDKEIASIIIMTDGEAPFPDEEAANGVPVLWLINNERVVPPWGKVARM